MKNLILDKYDTRLNLRDGDREWRIASWNAWKQLVKLNPKEYKLTIDVVNNWIILSLKTNYETVDRMTFCTHDKTNRTKSLR